MFIGSFSLAGFPFLSGFYSKDIILEVAYVTCTIDSSFAHWLGSLTACFTAGYSYRLLYFVFISEPNSYKKIMQNAHELPIIMGIPLFILSIGSIFTGYLSKDMFVGFGSTFFIDSIFVLPSNSTSFIYSEFIPNDIKLQPTMYSIFGIFVAYNVCLSGEFVLMLRFRFPIFNSVYKFLVLKWYFDFIYNSLIGKSVLKIAYSIIFKVIDKGFLEQFGPKGIVSLIFRISFFTKSLQSGIIYHYSCLIIIFFIFILPFLTDLIFNI
jgi:NADH:ubiquinone oxidoreductase subunit 5 (subunit L)/multisubunit Na+/H+ antiporter MnhA subunit